MKHSIALKIFALAVGIIALTLVVAVITNIEVIGLGNDISNVSRKTLPMSAQAADLNEAGLYRRVAFERLYREYGEPEPDAETISKERSNFDINTKRVYETARLLRQGMKEFPDNREERELLAEAREIVAQIETSFRATTELAEATLLARKSGERDKAKQMLAFTFEGQTQLRLLRHRLQDIASQLALASAMRAESRRDRVVMSSAVITLLAVVLGLGVAWMISRNLAQPVLQLLLTTKRVREGDLDIRVSGLPEDELGQLGDSFNAMVIELKNKENMQRAIGSYIDPRIVEKVILPGRPEDVLGQKRVMTILFADLAGFTTLAENLTPGGLVNIINRYFTLMSECVHAERGIIDKFIGDAIMAYWGPPFVAEEEQAAAACRAALRQLVALEKFRSELPELMGLRKNLPEINLRIGLATGEVIVGNIGSDVARNYTVMGDVVNLASRLESVNKVYGTRILISEETRRLASRAIETREIDLLTVKGKTEPVSIHEVLGEAELLPADWAMRRGRFETALETYRRQDWPAAEAIFLELAEKFKDEPSQAFANRIALLRQHSPGPGWDGVWHLSTK